MSACAAKSQNKNLSPTSLYLTTFFLHPPTNPFLFLSAAKGQRPRNYSSCCCCCSCWTFDLINALSTPTTMLPPIFLNILNYHLIYHSIYLSIYHSMYILLYLCIKLSIYHSIYPCLCLSINPLSICQSINQYSITADLGAGICLVGFFIWSIPYHFPPMPTYLCLPKPTYLGLPT